MVGNAKEWVYDFLMEEPIYGISGMSLIYKINIFIAMQIETS